MLHFSNTARTLFYGALVLGGAALAACSATAPKSAPVKPVVDDAVIEVDESTRPFPPQTLYELMAAELSGIGRDLNAALEIYRDQAHKTRDPGVIDRTIRIASYINNLDVVLEMAELWVEVEPENLDARRLAAYQLARAGRVLEAFPHAEFLLLAGDDDYLQSLSAFAKDASEDEKERLLVLYEELAGEHPQNIGLLLGKAMLLRQLQRNDESLAATRKVIKLDPGNETGQLLYAQLLYHQGDEKQGLKALEKALKHTPDSKRLRLQYARFLAEKDLEASREQMLTLASQYPDDADLLFSLALVDIELKHHEEAQEILSTLLQRRHRVDDVHFQLGRLAEAQDDRVTAIDEYRRVEQGESLMAAVVRLTDLWLQQDDLDSARSYLAGLRNQRPELKAGLYQLESEILSRANHPDQAVAVLSEALEENPGDINLLYTRSVITAQQKNLAAAEQDLRAILAIDPQNATALNALGYTLSNLSDRYKEAYTLIRQALKLDPDNPAIIDSLGWVYYQLGEFDKARRYLAEAYEAFPDPEVAAHYGEILWINGEQEEALTIWRKGLEADAQNPMIREAMERLTGSAP